MLTDVQRSLVPYTTESWSVSGLHPIDAHSVRISRLTTRIHGYLITCVLCHIRKRKIHTKGSTHTLFSGPIGDAPVQLFHFSIVALLQSIISFKYMIRRVFSQPLCVLWWDIASLVQIYADTCPEAVTARHVLNSTNERFMQRLNLRVIFFILKAFTG